MLQSCPHIRTKSIVIIIENANKSNGFGQSMGGTSTSRSKGWGYHEIEQEASSLVDISHRQVYCLELGGSIISKSSKKLNVLLNGFLTKRPPPIDKPRQASFACRGHSFSVKHHIPVDFRAWSQYTDRYTPSVRHTGLLRASSVLFDVCAQRNCQNNQNGKV